jgi:hypothetical protein
MPIATHVIADTEVLAADFNRVVDSIQDTSDGHNHSGAEGRGRQVAHADLFGATDTLEGGHTHEALDTAVDNSEAHIAAGKGVHGLPANVSVMGHTGEPGTLVMQCGVKSCYDNWRNDQGAVNTGLSSVLYAVATAGNNAYQGPQGDARWRAYPIINVSVPANNGGTFFIQTSESDGSQGRAVLVYWIAVGTK